MKRLALLVALVVLVVAACDSSSAIKVAVTHPGGGYVHWQQNGPTLERQIEVLVPASSEPNFLRGMNDGLAQVNRSPYLNMVLDVGGTCQSHCVLVDRAPINGAVTSWGWDSHGHMWGTAARITFDSGPWTVVDLTHFACHEAFHAAGLAHGQDHNGDGSPDTTGPCQGGAATTTDLNNIVTTTGHADPQVFTAQLEQSREREGRRGPPMKAKVHHTRADLLGR